MSANEKDNLLKGVQHTLADIETVTSDHQSMIARMREESARLARAKLPDAEEQGEALAFLDWLAANHFVFLGARTYEFEIDSEGKFLLEEPIMVEGSNLGLLRDETANVLSRGAEPTMLTRSVEEFLHNPEPLIIAKSTLRTRIHRPGRADYVGVKHYDENGRVIGETRFLGLFTAEAYDEAARSVPLLRRRVTQVLSLSGARSGGHRAKALANLLENWPRDELFQTDPNTLVEMLEGVLTLQGRPRIRLFLRRDRFDRFISALIYVPRDAYDSPLRQKLVAYLIDVFDAELLHYQPRFDIGSLVRLHIQLELGPKALDPDPQTLEKNVIALATHWEERFRKTLMSEDLAEDVRKGALEFCTAFSIAYRDDFDTDEALRDVGEFSKLSKVRPIGLRAYRGEDDSPQTIRAKIYSRGASVPLSESVPLFENMGLFVEFETGYQIIPRKQPSEDAPAKYWIHYVSMRHDRGAEIDLETIRDAFQSSFVSVWLGEMENDAFNRLIFDVGINGREANLLRGLSSYRRQTGMDPLKASQIEAFRAYPDITQLILDMFETLFDPEKGGEIKAREKTASEIFATILKQLNSVPSLEADRVLRRSAKLVMAIQRTNYYSPKSGPLAFKIASSKLDDLPRPVPYREIFVTSPQVEGIHLRFGAVARGGLRWTDRPYDFRTEVLGLVKAQQVKNAVIVPVGSKGGFFPRQIPANARREEVREVGISAYRTFISALLDLTDNLVKGDIQHPADMVIRDEADPYLVVAADKGTASFSDIANEISAAHGYWLGDAFASGGSAGYDHKKMGITARGGWEAVKRHFLEAGKDIQKEAFTVIGVGDMAGDVFGNGMLLSKQIQLQAAFNHMHIFIDPDPQDTLKSWTERKRLFDMPRSSWADYDQALISEGGGIYQRAAKSIPLSEEVKSLTGLKADEVTPDELIHALLKCPAELLWFGGIGTYIRSSQEQDRDVGDRANDAVRITAKELSAKIIGEGANLGLTQAARIEYALKGGRINTDAIDNSAGVDSSDHEVNIKILLSEVIRAKKLPSGERNLLLASMTDTVAEHVLAHNITQTRALSLAEYMAEKDHAALERLMLWLEDRGVLDRQVEGLPTSEEMSKRAETGAWLTRPELSVLLAWAKIIVFDDLVASDLPDDAYFKPVLKSYFPEALQTYETSMQAHPLKREIIATVLANRLLDAAGPALFIRLLEFGSCSVSDCVRAFEIARAVLKMPTLTNEIDDLGQSGNVEAQILMHLFLIEQISDVAYYLLHADMAGTTKDIIARYTNAFEILSDDPKAYTSAFKANRQEQKMRRFIKAGAKESLARKVANLVLVARVVHIVALTKKADKDLRHLAAIFGELDAVLKIDRLRASANDAMMKISHWEQRAVRGQLAILLDAQVSATEQIYKEGGDVQAFLKPYKSQVAALPHTLRKMNLARDWSFAKYSLAAQAVQDILT